VDWRLAVASDGSAVVDVAHFGAELGDVGAEMLGRDLSAVAGEGVHVRDVALPGEPLSADASDGAAWFVRVLDGVGRFQGLYACLGVPAPCGGPDGGLDGGAEFVRDEVLAAAAHVPGGRARMVPATSWTLRVQTEPCTDVSLADAGPPEDANPLTDASADGSHD
jgi:hypothetical protein